MQDGNTPLSHEAQAALRRIRALQAVSAKTRYVTTKEQMEILITLSPEDMVQVADILKRETR
jgi:hypothetical protein